MVDYDATSPMPPKPDGDPTFPDSPEGDPKREPSRDPWHEPGPPVRKINLPPDSPSPGVPVPNVPKPETPTIT